MPGDPVPTRGRAGALPRVLVELLEEFPVDDVVDEALVQVRTEVPAFAVVDPDEMRTDVGGALALALAVLARGFDDGQTEADALRGIGALRAEQGVAVDDVLAAFRIVARVSVDRALAMARERGVSPTAALDLTRAIWAHSDAAAAALAAGHKAWVEESADDAAPGEAALRRLLRGGLPAPEIEQVAGRLGLDPGAAYHVVVASGGPSGPAALLASVADRLAASYVDRSEGRVIGLTPHRPSGPWGCRAGYGDPVALLDLRASLRGAVQAWRLAVAFGLDEVQHPDDVALLRPVRAMPELGDSFVARCFGHLDDVRREATVETLRAWFAAQGSADVAAGRLFVHRNTLRYRIRAFTRATGLRLDRPEDAFVVWWALRRLELDGRNADDT